MNGEHRRTMLLIGVFFFVWKILTLVFSYLALSIPLNVALSPYPSFFYKDLSPLIWSLANFDGSHYLEIAFRGYYTLEQGFFPLYPLLIRIVAPWLHGAYLVSGLIISHLCFIGALYYSLKLLAFDHKKQFDTLVLLIIFLFPTSFFYGAVYNDSLFLLLATLTLLHGRKGNWLYAGFFGALATLARLNGLALFFFLIIEYYAHKRFTLPSPRPLFNTLPHYLPNLSSLRQLTPFLLIPSAFLGYLLFIHLTTGSFTNVFSSMHVWHQDKLILPPQVVWRYLKIIFLHSEMTLSYWVAVTEFAAVLWYLFILMYSWKKIRRSYWIFFAVSILIPSLTGTFQGMPRYGLHLYPFFLGSALFLQTQPKIIRVIYCMICGTLLGIFITLFTRGYFIA